MLPSSVKGEKIMRVFLLSFALLALSLPTVAKTTGETAQYEIKGDTVLVNNHICAYSKSPMAKETLGTYTSKVVYKGNNPKFAQFKNKTLVFNQCCTMCLDKFPDEWKKNPEAIMTYHGLK